MKAKAEVRAESFDQFGLGEPLLKAIAEVGYETPSPIQHKTIPLLLAGRDLVGQAQTGTGKTAAFALPILERLGPGEKGVQALVLTPTRELAIQVAEAFHTYAKHMGGVRVLPVYGGQPIGQQLRRLRGGVQVVVGTPGRVMDHLRRESLDLTSLKFVVLDEADEMLRMGFIEDVEWILEHTPPGRQTALFSATMPREVRRIADRHLRGPAAVEIEHRTLTVPTVEQRYVNVSEGQKPDVLTRLLEAEAGAGEAALIFARTKVGAADRRVLARLPGAASGRQPRAPHRQLDDRFLHRGECRPDRLRARMDVERGNHPWFHDRAGDGSVLHQVDPLTSALVARVHGEPAPVSGEPRVVRVDTFTSDGHRLKRHSAGRRGRLADDSLKPTAD